MKSLSLFLVFIALSAVGLHAERLVPVPFNISATLYIQNTNSATSGTIVTTGPTVIYQITTAGLLKSLAKAEHAKSNFSATTFPVGAKLVYLVNLDDAAQSRFCVMSASGTLLVDVSDIMSFSGDGNDGTHKGRYNTANGTLSNATYAYMALINYDDTSAPGGTMKYYLIGLYADHENDAVSFPAKTFTRTIEMKSLCVSGSGTFGSNNVTGGGTAYGKGSATLPLQ